MGKIAFIFPGQGSQSVGMGKAAAETNERAKAIIEQADARLVFPLSDIMYNGPQEKLTLTTNAQPALLTASIAILQLLIEAGIQPDYTAGHSLGEYSALVAAGAMSFEDAVYAVRKRGEFMEEAVPNGEGTMAAVLGMDRDLLLDVCETVSSEGHPVQLANLNCPGQIVISGSKLGVELASERAKEKGAKRVIPLQVSGPFHSALMKPAAEKFRKVLDEITIKDASIPVVANVTANELIKATEIKNKLIEQLYSPVLWEDSVRYMINQGVDTFIEVGAGKVLTGLVKKIDRSVSVFNVFDPESCQQVIDALKEVQ
jgi:[acyl-carrier-protein] S-malonyltransferase